MVKNWKYRRVDGSGQVWLSGGEVARRFGVSTVTIRTWCEQGKLKGMRIVPGGYYWYREEDVIALQKRGGLR